jgi:intron-binding protein aquarius
MLARRLLLLAEVERLARSLGVPEEAGAGYTCETAGGGVGGVLHWASL